MAKIANFFKNNADSIYLKGLEKTGITLNKIPNIKTENTIINIVFSIYF